MSQRRVESSLAHITKYVVHFENTRLTDKFDIGNSLCATSRGGIYDPAKSKQWSGLGMWQLGLPDMVTAGSGQYGFDSIAASSRITNVRFSMSNVLLSAISSTDYFLGYFGVGLRSGNFGDVVASPPLRQAVASFGWIPSYSYGYTAGASYRGIVGSATLGGYDSARFAPHDTTFTMNQTEGIPRPLVRGIQVAAVNGSRPAAWKSETMTLLQYNNSFTAVIDTTTPYLWLPPTVCDRFARALNLTYNNTYSLYTLTNDQYRQYSSDDFSMAFTFSLSSEDNRDNFGLPLHVPGVVNITVPIRAFVSLLEYPFMNSTIAYGTPAVPYFTLRRAPDDTFIIGNAFMQEAYLITQYDSGIFSIHQARFPADAIGGAQLQAIRQPSNSPYPAPPNPSTGNGLSAGPIAGIVVGSVALCSIFLLAFLCYRRRRQRQQRQRSGHRLDDGKDASSTLTPSPPKSLVYRVLSRTFGMFCRHRRTGAASRSGAGGGNPFEAPDCQIYELPAPSSPAELDALDAGGDDDYSVLGDTDLGTDSTQHLSAYEVARRKLDRQLQGPVPEYLPPTQMVLLPPEKMPIPDVALEDRTSATHQQPSPVSPPLLCADSTSSTFVTSEPSPISHREGDWSLAELPSPLTTNSNAPSSRSSGTRTGGGYSTAGSPSAPAPDGTSPSPAAVQRTPIDPSRVVCLGPLPGNVPLPGQNIGTASRIVGPDGRSTPVGAMLAAGSRHSDDSLGSDFTDDEGMAGAEEARRHQAAPPGQPGNVEDGNRPVDAESSDADVVSETGRIDPGRDLIHVPQLAERRYSWEEERPEHPQQKPQ
ncbi:hypothetical protein UVI_02040810 [Ustilaginoidea virens]|uniref:Peptidase A1 domain-containing protein n=1 Tax=Ustilaginoidea virens TaxID=1159556 RepID=A0A1B5L881_USTVR|nr:hypothetical protein UVI_02040810 [Ustilaginoidea virens]